MKDRAGEKKYVALAALMFILAACGSNSTGSSATQPVESRSAQSDKPVVMASGLTLPSGLAVDSTSLYYTADDPTTLVGTLWKLPVSGGSPTKLAAVLPTVFSEFVAVDPTSAYLISNDSTPGLIEVPLGGGTPQAIASGPSLSLPCGQIAVDSTSVYWAGSGSGDGEVWEVPLGGGAPVDLASGQSLPCDVAVDLTNVYWADSTGGTVMEVPLSGGAPVTLASGQSKPAGIAVDSTSVYWWTAYGTVMKVPVSGGTPVTLATGQTAQGPLAVDSTSVYWTNSTGTVMKVALNGGAPVTLASGQNNPHGIAVDSTSVYWVNFVSGVDNGTVMKVAK